MLETAIIDRKHLSKQVDVLTGQLIEERLGNVEQHMPLEQLQKQNKQKQNEIENMMEDQLNVTKAQFVDHGCQLGKNVHMNEEMKERLKLVKEEVDMKSQVGTNC